MSNYPPLMLNLLWDWGQEGWRLAWAKMLAIRMIYVEKYYDNNGRLPLVMLENQIMEDKEGGNDFKVRFVLFVLGALLCPIMKLFVKHSFLHLVETSIQ